MLCFENGMVLFSDNIKPDDSGGNKGHIKWENSMDTSGCINAQKNTLNKLEETAINSYQTLTVSESFQWYKKMTLTWTSTSATISAEQ